jgi:hypothetical protein
LAAEHKRLIREFLARVLAEMGVAEPELMAAQLFLLGEGVIVASQVGGIDELEQSARVAAESLMQGRAG